MGALRLVTAKVSPDHNRFRLFARESCGDWGTRYLPIGEEGSFCLVELFPEDELPGGSGI